MSRLLRLVLWPLMLLTLLPSLVLADPPARVGRLAHLENGVNFRVDRSTERGPATVNWPISSGAILDTEWRGRAEVWIGSTAYRVAGNSEVEFAQVDDQQISVNVTVGSLTVSILDRDQADDLIVTTPEGNVRFTTPGRYRIDVLSDHSEVTAQAGQAVVDDRHRPISVVAGQKARLYQDQPPRIDGDFDQDNFDSWVAERENATVANATRRHVSPQMTGYQDLDAYGDWRPEPEYGTVWYPRAVAADWAPYRYGRWAWVAPWGWTWIDQTPWGFAPFHYGRWVHIQNRWAWAPGSHVARPVYAPALVGWIGNPGWNVSFSFGSAPAVGWFPLAPREVYVPAYRYSPTYIRQINITHVQDVKVIDRAIRPGAREHFVHRDRQQAITVVPASLMREGRAISSRELRRPERHELERAPPARQAPSQDWLAPAASASRPSHDERRETANGRPRRDGDQPSRQMSSERPAPRLAPATNAPRQPEPRQAMPAANNERRHEDRRDESPNANLPPDARPDTPRPERERRQPPSTIQPVAPSQTTAPPLRPVESAPPARPAANNERRHEGRRDESPNANLSPDVRPDTARPESERRQPPSTVQPVAPSQTTAPPARPARPETATPRREAPAPAPQSTPAMQLSPGIAPNPTRGDRPERRETQRNERSAPRENAPPVMPQREAPPAVPAAVRAAPQPATPQAMPPPPQPVREERRPPPFTPAPDREPRREMRETPRPERNMPRESEAPASRQREAAPQAAPSPAIRAPQPQPQPRPQPQAQPQPQQPQPQVAAPKPPAAAPMPPRQEPRGDDRDKGRDKVRGQERGEDKGERGAR